MGQQEQYYTTKTLLLEVIKRECAKTPKKLHEIMCFMPDANPLDVDIALYDLNIGGRVWIDYKDNISPVKD